MIASKSGDIIRHVEAVLIDDFKTTKTGGYLYSVKESHKYFSEEVKLWGEGSLIFTSEKKCKKGKTAYIDCIIKKRQNELTAYPLKNSLDKTLEDLHRQYNWLKLKKQLNARDFALKISETIPFYCWFNYSLILSYFEEDIRKELANLSANYCIEKLEVPLFPRNDYIEIFDVQVKRTYTYRNEYGYKVEKIYEPFHEDYFFSFWNYKNSRTFYAKRSFGIKGKALK